MAVPTAMTSATSSRTSFFLSMAYQAPFDGPRLDGGLV
jgi:hypothetical protein